MKNLHAIVFATSLLFVGGPSGCALFSKTATQEEKLKDIRLLAYSAASLGTREALLQNPDWKPKFVEAYEQLNHFVETRVITGNHLRGIIASLPVKELKSEQARIAIDAVLVLYDATVGEKVDIEKQPYVLSAATGVRDGLKVALAQ